MAKTKKYRGSRTHGRGTKKGRGAGLRGGRGRGGSKKHKHLMDFGKHGFTHHFADERKLVKFINVGDLSKLKKGKEINLKELGYDKLLGKGSIDDPMVIAVPKASSKAKEKIEKVGGSLILDNN
jgi:large subunit ribosomal protein L15